MVVAGAQPLSPPPPPPPPGSTKSSWLSSRRPFLRRTTAATRFASEAFHRASEGMGITGPVISSGRALPPPNSNFSANLFCCVDRIVKKRKTKTNKRFPLTCFVMSIEWVKKKKKSSYIRYTTENKNKNKQNLITNQPYKNERTNKRTRSFLSQVICFIEKKGVC